MGRRAHEKKRTLLPVPGVLPSLRIPRRLIVGVPEGRGSGRTNEWNASSTDGDLGRDTSGEDRVAGEPELRYGDDGDLPAHNKWMDGQDVSIGSGRWSMVGRDRDRERLNDKRRELELSPCSPSGPVSSLVAIWDGDRNDGSLPELPSNTCLILLLVSLPLRLPPAATGGAVRGVSPPPLPAVELPSWAASASTAPIECRRLNRPPLFFEGDGELTGVWDDASARSGRPPPGLDGAACFDRKNGDDGPERKEEIECECSEEERGREESRMEAIASAKRGGRRNR